MSARKKALVATRAEPLPGLAASTRAGRSPVKVIVYGLLLDGGRGAGVLMRLLLCPMVRSVHYGERAGKPNG